MKTILMLSALFLLSISAVGQQNSEGYDPVLAKKLGADDYGMKWYVMVILKTGSNHEEDKAKRDSLFAGHMRNIGRLAELGKLVVAGPFGENDKAYRGIFILNVPTFEEANELLKTDPTIKQKIFAVDLFKWYGSAALSEYLGIHKKIQKMNIQ
ncbi:MAG: YciI family protein [Prolixibacteraceae bacterium]